MRIANLTRVRIAMASPMQSEARVFSAFILGIDDQGLKNLKKVHHREAGFEIFFKQTYYTI